MGSETLFCLRLEAQLRCSCTIPSALDFMTLGQNSREMLLYPGGSPALRPPASAFDAWPLPVPSCAHLISSPPLPSSPIQSLCSSTLTSIPAARRRSHSHARPGSLLFSSCRRHLAHLPPCASSRGTPELLSQELEPELTVSSFCAVSPSSGLEQGDGNCVPVHGDRALQLWPPRPDPRSNLAVVPNYGYAATGAALLLVVTAQLLPWGSSARCCGER